MPEVYKTGVEINVIYECSGGISYSSWLANHWHKGYSIFLAQKFKG